MSAKLFFYIQGDERRCKSDQGECCFSHPNTKSPLHTKGAQLMQRDVLMYFYVCKHIVKENIFLKEIPRRPFFFFNPSLILRAFIFRVETFEVVKRRFIYQRQPSCSARVCAQYFHDTGARIVAFKHQWCLSVVDLVQTPVFTCQRY